MPLVSGDGGYGSLGEGEEPQPPIQRPWVLTLFSLLCFLPILPGDCACSGSGIGELFDRRGFPEGWFLGKWWRKTAFRRRDLPAYGASSLLIRGL